MKEIKVLDKAWRDKRKDEAKNSDVVRVFDKDRHDFHSKLTGDILFEMNATQIVNKLKDQKVDSLKAMGHLYKLADCIVTRAMLENNKLSLKAQSDTVQQGRETPNRELAKDAAQYAIKTLSPEDFPRRIKLIDEQISLFEKAEEIQHKILLHLSENKGQSQLSKMEKEYAELMKTIKIKQREEAEKPTDAYIT